MGFLDLIRRKPKKDVEVKPEPEVIHVPTVTHVPAVTTIPNVQPPFCDSDTSSGSTSKVGSGLDLTKRIDLKLSKELDLEKKEVRDETQALLDVSGSMSEHVGQKRKIDSLREVMNKYKDMRMICFSDNVKPISDVSKIPEPDGTTNLAGAFKYIKNNVKPHPKRIVLISDGEPDSEYSALEWGRKLQIPVDIVFIGSEKSKGNVFMRKLAEDTGGRNFAV